MLTVADVMTKDVEAVTPETSLRALVELLSKRHVSGVPVVSADRVIGVVSGSDVLAFIAALPERENDVGGDSDAETGESCLDGAEGGSAASRFSAAWRGPADKVADRLLRRTPGPVSDPVATHVVADVMTSPARSISATVDVREAADTMRQAGIHRMVVLDGARLAGIVTTSDLARAVADRRLLSPDTYIEVDLRCWP